MWFNSWVFFFFFFWFYFIYILQAYRFLLSLSLSLSLSLFLFLFFFIQKSVIALHNQIKMVKEYVRKLNGIVGAERTNFILANSLFFLVTGSNDITNTYYVSHVRKFSYDLFLHWPYDQVCFRSLRVKFSSPQFTIHDSLTLFFILIIVPRLQFSYKNNLRKRSES